MSRNYYILNNGRIRRDQNTVYIEAADGAKKPLPVEDIDSLYLYGEIDLNTRLLNFLTQRKITLHVFNYYGFYSGSYYPREYLHSGHLVVQQVRHYTDPAKRLPLARELVHAAAHSLLRNLAYYANRKTSSAAAASDERDPTGEIAPAIPTDDAPTADIPPGVPTDPLAENAIDTALTLPLTDLDLNPWEPQIDFDTGEILNADSQPAPRAETDIDPALALVGLQTTIRSLTALLPAQTTPDAIRGIEGKTRLTYYRAWQHILTGDWAFRRRVRRPPDNEINALLGFGNSFLYTVCLGEIYRTQLTPTISYLHEPGARRYSLALDLSEIFKPLLVDRTIFRLLNTGQLKPTHFDKNLDGCYLTDPGKRIFIQALHDRLDTTIKHRRLGRSVSYRHLIRLECYKLIRHLTGIERYRAFRAWW